MERSGPIGFLFSPANRPATIAIILAVAALVAYFLLSGDNTTTAASSSTTSGSGASAAALEGAGAGSDSTLAPSETLGGLPVGLTSDECLAAASAFSLASTGGFGTTGVDATRIDDAFAQMSAVAPSAIADDLATMAAAFREFFSILDQENVNLDDPNALVAEGAADALMRAGAALEASGFSEAAENVNAWLEATCADYILTP